MELIFEQTQPTFAESRFCRAEVAVHAPSSRPRSVPTGSERIAGDRFRWCLPLVLSNCNCLHGEPCQAMSPSGAQAGVQPLATMWTYAACLQHPELVETEKALALPQVLEPEASSLAGPAVTAPGQPLRRQLAASRGLRPQRRAASPGGQPASAVAQLALS
mmetsp:Transcript_132009/g.240115  ORF Transcript_132009/g.240115 Transcript_132009/m.240115 type:complete len:161 (+) Transcript_132009:888-1370(+)